MITALVLAAGESRRMGRPKLLLPFGKQTMIEKVISQVVQSQAEYILVILGAEGAKIKNQIKNWPISTVFNSHYKQGMLSSIKCGFRNLPEKTEAVLVWLGDQPSIPATVADQVIETYRKMKKGIVVPVYNKDRGHPVLIDIKYKKEIENLDPAIGLRQLVYNHHEDTIEVKVNTSSILRDIDSVDDYEQELKGS
ncbi:MAG: NTP transferase domain-containing protein [Candidatus Aminicenantales bacterium]